jgi:predicted aminopeptidase
VYAADLSDEEKRLRKAALQASMREAYQELKQSWGGIGAFDGWFAGALNNAQIATVSSYNRLVPGFQRLLDEAGGDLESFYERVRNLATLDEPSRNAALGID